MAEFTFGKAAGVSEIFVHFDAGGRLAGVEVYGLAGDVFKPLPTEDMLVSLQFGRYLRTTHNVVPGEDFSYGCFSYTVN